MRGRACGPSCPRTATRSASPEILHVRLDRHEAMIVTDLLTFARRKHADTRGIVLSTFEEDVHRYQREDGVLAVLEKPVEVPRLRRELEGLTPYRASGPRD